MNPDQKILEDICLRIIDAVHPLRIILFGSASRGEMKVDSDLDVLVIVNDGANRLETAQSIHRKLFGVKVPVDIIVATIGDLERYSNSIGMVYRKALSEGKELYHAA